MIIVDNNALSRAIKEGKMLTGPYVITTDIREEFEVAFSGRLPRNTRDVCIDSAFDGANYYVQYKKMLNKYGGRSFYNLTGFGDISILALLCVQKEKMTGVLPVMIEEHTVVTNDDGLIKKLKNEYGDVSHPFDIKVKIIGYDEFVASL
jgi:hypothetical protein